MNMINERLQSVRIEMQRLGLDALIVRTEDPHCSEYPANHWKFREYLSGFDGSQGILVITLQHAGLWVDSRYYIQAEQQTKDVSIDVFKDGLAGVPSYADWITYTLPSEATCGVDGFTIPYAEYKILRNKLSLFGIHIEYKVNIMDELFLEREDLPLNDILEMDYSLNQLTRAEKVALVRKEMLRINATHYLVSSLDSIAWLMNMRGTDVEFNPVFYAYMIVTATEEHLYIDPHKLTSVISRRLDEEGIKVSLYSHFEKNISNLPSGSRVMFDPDKTNARNVLSLPASVYKIEQQCIIEQIKAVKTVNEISHIESAHIRDGHAMVKLLYWLSKEYESGAQLTELGVAEKLHEIRSREQLFISESFGSISAFGKNGAIIHYEPTDSSNAPINGNGFLLLDTGAQYADGTTDITRTIALGDVELQSAIDYTLVLKGHIALAKAIFPEETHASQLDTLARMAMWNHCIDYGHGTGHGVGFFLNVHEGPQRIGKRDNGSVMKAGMITSNEPGIYREGRWGVRIENLMVCEEAGRSSFGNFLKHRILTICPIDKNPILIDMLTDEVKRLS